MKILLFLLFLSYSSAAFSQPNPQEAYPERIKAITEQLKTDSLNYQLIWERLNMKVNLLGGFPTRDEVFSFQIDSNQIRRKQILYDEFNTDFVKIYQHAIRPRKFEIVEEGDFYLSRIWFYFNMLEPDKAIKDAKYLKESASYSRFSGRGDYYNEWAINSLFNLYVIKKDYAGALNTIDEALKKSKAEDPKLYYCTNGGFLTYADKIQLLEHFGKKDEIIAYLKQICREQFNWYFEKAKYQNEKEEKQHLGPTEYYTSKDDYQYFMGCAKDKCLEHLRLLVNYLKKYGSEELLKYGKIYNEIRYRVSETYERINPGISDEALMSIFSSI